MSSSDESESGSHYRTSLAPQAQWDFEPIHEHTAREMPVAAEHWIDELIIAVRGLWKCPRRAPERLRMSACGSGCGT